MQLPSFLPGFFNTSFTGWEILPGSNQDSRSTAVSINIVDELSYQMMITDYDTATVAYKSSGTW